MQIGNRLIAGSFFRTVEYFVQVAVTFVMTPFIISRLGERNYGFWSIVASLVGYYGLLDLGIRTAVTRFASKALGKGDLEQANRTISVAFFFFLATLPFTVVLSAVACYWVRFQFAGVPESPKISLVVLFLSLRMAFGLPIRVFSGVLATKIRYDLQAAVGILHVVVVNALIYILLGQGMGIVAMAAATLTVSLLEYGLTVYFSYLAFPQMRLRRRYFFGDELRTIIRYSSVSWVNHTLVLVFTRVQPPLVAALATVSMVAYYSIADHLARYFVQFLMAVLGNFVPVFSMRDGQEDRQALIGDFRTLMKFSVCGSVFTALSIVWFAEPFITRWLGLSFGVSYQVLVVLLAGCVLNTSQIPAINILYALSKHHYGTVLNAFRLVLFFLLVFTLGREHGLFGIAYATVIPILLGDIVFVPLIVSRVLDIRPWDYYIKVLVLPAATTMLPFALTYPLLNRNIEPEYPSILLMASLHTLICLPFLYLLVLGPRERRFIELRVSYLARHLPLPSRS